MNPVPSRNKISTNANPLDNHYRTTADHPDYPGHPNYSGHLYHLTTRPNFNLADLFLKLEFFTPKQCGADIICQHRRVCKPSIKLLAPTAAEKTGRHHDMPLRRVKGAKRVWNQKISWNLSCWADNGTIHGGPWEGKLLSTNHLENICISKYFMRLLMLVPWACQVPRVRFRVGWGDA